MAWSYGEPITIESVGDLDLDTFAWLSQAIIAESGIQPDAEKKDSGSSSSPTSGRVKELSPKSSGI